MKSFSPLSGLMISIPLIFVLWMSACTHDPANIDELEAVCFDTQVMPILKTSCGISGCHDGTAEGFRVSDYNSVRDLVQPGDPRGSKLYRIITDINSDDMMPPDVPLTKTQRSIIHVWIAQGANEKICTQDTGVPVQKVCFVQDILPVIASSCGVTGCHDAITAEEEYVLVSYATIMQRGIQPFNAQGSKIYEVVTDNGEDIMPPPPRSPLTVQQIADLREWIEDGALNSDCPGNACDSAGVISFAAQVDPILKNNCTGCHNSTLASGNVNLTGYTNVAVQAANLRNGVPIMVGSMQRATGFIAMPPAFALDECRTTTVKKWIDQGAANN